MTDTNTDFIIERLMVMAQIQTKMAENIIRLNNILNDIANPDIEWVNRQEAAKYLNVSGTTVSRYGKDGKVEVDGRGMFRYKSLVEYKWKG